MIAMSLVTVINNSLHVVAANPVDMRNHYCNLMNFMSTSLGLKCVTLHPTLMQCPLMLKTFITTANEMITKMKPGLLDPTTRDAAIADIVKVAKNLLNAVSAPSATMQNPAPKRPRNVGVVTVPPPTSGPPPSSVAPSKPKKKRKTSKMPETYDDHIVYKRAYDIMRSVLHSLMSKWKDAARDASTGSMRSLEFYQYVTAKYATSVKMRLFHDVDTSKLTVRMMREMFANLTFDMELLASVPDTETHQTKTFRRVMLQHLDKWPSKQEICKVFDAYALTKNIRDTSSEKADAEEPCAQPSMQRGVSMFF